MLTWGDTVTPETSKMLSAVLSVSTSRDVTLDTTESAFLVMRWCTFCTRKMLTLNSRRPSSSLVQDTVSAARSGLYEV